MKKSKFSEYQIIAILKEVEQGQKVGDVCRQHGISNSLYYQWKSKYGGLEASELRRIKDLESENARLKKMYADLSLVHDALKDAMAKKL
jgi:putative transposase